VAKYFASKSKQINARMINRVVYSEFVAPTISLGGNPPLDRPARPHFHLASRLPYWSSWNGTGRGTD